MSAVFSIIPCCEVAGSVSENYTEDGIECSVSLQCDYLNRHLLAADILANRRPWPYGSFVGFPKAKTAAIKPLETVAATDGQGMVYIDAIVTVKYTLKRDDKEEDEDGQLYSESLEPSVQFMTLDHKQFKWKDADGDMLLENEAPGKQLHSMALVRTLYGLDAIPNAMLTQPGKVNTSAYTSAVLGLTFPAQTLLFMPQPATRSITTEGTKGWDLGLRFEYKPEGWNKFWRAKTETWEEIYDVKGEKVYKNYPLGNFSAFLF